MAKPSLLCTACPSAWSGPGLARVTLAEALPVLDTCPPAWDPPKRPHAEALGTLREKGRGAPFAQLAKPRSHREGGALDHSPEGWRPWGGGWATRVSPPPVSRTPGHTWRQSRPHVGPGSPAKKAGPTGPRPCQPTPWPSPPPGRTGEKHVTQGLAPRSFSLTSPCHPTPGREPIGCARASGRGLSGSVPQLPLGLQWLPCASPLGDKPARSSGCQTLTCSWATGLWTPGRPLHLPASVSTSVNWASQPGPARGSVWATLRSQAARGQLPPCLLGTQDRGAPHGLCPAPAPAPV